MISVTKPDMLAVICEHITPIYSKAIKARNAIIPQL